MLRDAWFRAEDEVHRAENATTRPEVIQSQPFFHVQNRERHEYRQRDRLLKNFQLGDVVALIADSVGRNLNQIFEQRDSPTEQRGPPPRLVLQIPKVCVPGEGHEDIG